MNVLFTPVPRSFVLALYLVIACGVVDVLRIALI